jgi:hypothetical protein
MKAPVALGIVMGLSTAAAAQPDDGREQERRQTEAHNYKISLRQMDEATTPMPTPEPGLETAPVRSPAWCTGPKAGKYTPGEALDSTRAQLSQIDRYWMDALLGAAERLCDADLADPMTQRAGAFIEQHWINRMGLSSKDAVESIRLRLGKQAFEDGKTRLCSALTVSDEVAGPERKHMAARRDLFDCGGDSVQTVATAPMIELVAWLDASGTEPDEMVRLTYVAFEARATLGDEDYRNKTLPYYVMDQFDYKAFQPDKVLALLATEPYKGNPYAQAVAKEQLAAARRHIAAVEDEVKKRSSKDAEWKELLVTAPQGAFAAWSAVAAKWAGELMRSSEFEQEAYGPSRKALAGCVAPLKKDLETVLRSLKRDTVEEFKQQINDNMVAGLLLKRYVVCQAAAGEPMVASGFRKHLDGIRVTRGPRVAAYFAALDALIKIREDRAKFPVEPHNLPFDRSELLDELASDILSSKKYDTVGFTDVQKGVVKAVKKGPKGVTVSFNPARRQIYTESCTTTNRIVMFDHSGNPIYYRNCKPTGLQWIDESPDPILIAGDLAEGITAGKTLVFAVVPYNYGDRMAMPLELYADKTGKKLVGFFGLVL